MERLSFDSSIKMNNWLKNKDGFPYCVSGFMGLDLFFVPTHSRRDSVNVARDLLRQGRERAKRGRLAYFSDISLEISDRSGAIFAEINHAGEIRKDPDFGPDASYFATALQGLREEIC